MESKSAYNSKFCNSLLQGHTHVDVEERKNPQLSVELPCETPAVESFRLGGLGNDVVVGEHHALGHASCSLMDSLVANEQEFPIK